MSDKTHRLPYDFARCDNAACQLRDGCQRYRDRDHCGERTPSLVWGNAEDWRGCYYFIRAQANNEGQRTAAGKDTK